MKSARRLLASLIAVLFITGMSPMQAEEPYKKRSPATVVEPIQRGNIEYRAGGKCLKAWIEEWDLKTNTLLGEYPLYEKTENPEMELDVQCLFIAKMELDKDGRTINITDESGAKYIYDTAPEKFPIESNY